MWNAVLRLSLELTHIVTGQPYRMPPKLRLTQEQKMYELVKSEGVEAAIQWFDKNGKKAAWGGSNYALAHQLIRDGLVDEGLRLMEYDIELTPGKVWMLRKAAQASLDNGRPNKTLIFLNKALELRPDDEQFETMKREAERDMENDQGT